MYVRRVSGNRTAGILILFVLMLPPLAVILFSVYRGEMLFTAALVALMLASMGIYTALRLQLTSYVYEISDDEKPGQYDLIIRSVCGKRIRTECRVSLRGRLEAAQYKKQRDEAMIRYCPLFCDGTVRIFRPDEANGKYLVVICPDEEMLRIMIALGVEE